MIGTEKKKHSYRTVCLISFTSHKYLISQRKVLKVSLYFLSKKIRLLNENITPGQVLSHCDAIKRRETREL